MMSVNNPLSIASATHAAKRAAEIVYVLQNKDALDKTLLVERLNKTLQTYGEQDPDVVVADLNGLTAVSKKLYAVFATKDADDTARALNILLSEYAHTPRLSAHGAFPWHLHVDGQDYAPWPQWLASASALALAVLLADRQRNPAGICASQTCGRPFIDSGKGGGRTYCSPRCASRERVAVYRRKRDNASV